MKYLDLFTGIGGFTLGIQKAYESISKAKGQQQRGDEGNQPVHGYEVMEPQCIGYSEIDRYASSIYQKHYPTHKNYGDITKIDECELPDFDLLVGGFPCQSFSIAGKRGGFNDTRGTLFFDIARILKAKRPKKLLLENVKGLLFHDNGNTFKTIVSALDELGYDLQWQVLNSKDFGVPQNRERILIVGHLRGTARPEVFPFGGDLKEADGLSGQHSNTLTARYYGGQANGTYVIEGELDAQEIRQLNDPVHSNDRVYGAEGISPTLNTMQGGNRQPFVAIRETKDGFHQHRNDPKKSSIQGTHVTYPEGCVHCLNTAHKPMTMEGISIRRLTPVECERLQGFPDNWTREGTIGDGPDAVSSLISDTQRYKCCGNAVTVNVIQAVMERLLAQS